MRDISKKTGVVLLLVAIIIAVFLTFGILNYLQTPKVIEITEKDSDSSGTVSLTVKKQSEVKDESLGSVS